MASPRLASARPSFIQSDRALARAAQPFVRFSHIEASGGVVLVIATLVALVWANTPWSASYESLWHTEISVEVGSYLFREDLGHLVNDLLMAMFFFVVGMEIKREMVVGDLRDRKTVALPALAALGGMVVPALIFVGLAGSGGAREGWGVPMATDIAFAVGVVALLGSRVPSGAKLMLLTLAIVDDIGAIVVIALVYSSDVDPKMLVVAALIVVVLVAFNRADVTYVPMIAFTGLALWLAVYESGVHATIAGVVMGLLTPARPHQTELEAEEIVDVLEGREDITVADIRATAAAIRGSVSACDRMIDALHPWTSFVIVPLFALANAGIELSADTFTSPSRVLGAVAIALVVGKLVGVSLFSWLAVRLRIGRLPAGVAWRHVFGIGGLAGIGFTVSLFITGLAFTDEQLATDAKAGIIVAALVATALGSILFVRAARSDQSS
ncbi:MAG: Na+/H+ antiporter NhaA [Desertimonas sp.]